jgi:segregation and condensation protein B
MEKNMTPVTDEMNGTATRADVETPVSLSNGHPVSVEIAEPSGDDDSAAQAVAARELKAIVESLLFVSSEPLSIQRLLAVIGDVTKAEVTQALRSLGEELEQEGRGLRLAEVAGGFRLLTKQEYAGWIKRLDKSKSTAKLSRSALESLAIIAYKQPIVRSEIEEIRGVETSGVVRTLLERKLVRIVGRKEVPGRPIMYGTTKYFLEHFGLNDLSQLPPLREFKELGEAEQALLPMDDALPVTADGAAADKVAKSIEGVCQEALSMNGEESFAEFKVEEELKGREELAEGETALAFEAEINGVLTHEPVEPS